MVSCAPTTCCANTPARADPPPATPSGTAVSYFDRYHVASITKFPHQPRLGRDSPRHRPHQPDAAQSAFGRIVVESQASIVEAAPQRGPARSHIAEGPGKLRLARELAHRALGPSGQGLGNRL